MVYQSFFSTYACFRRRIYNRNLLLSIGVETETYFMWRNIIALFLGNCSDQCNIHNASKFISKTSCDLFGIKEIKQSISYMKDFGYLFFNVQDRMV